MRIDKAAEAYSDQRDTASGQGLNSLKHGAYSYLSRVKNGQPIPEGLALVESQVQQELLEGGSLNLLRANVVRLQTAADLLWSNMAVNADRFHSGLKSFGWLTNSSIRALEKLSQLEQETSKASIDLVAAMSEPVEQGDDED